MNVKKVLPVILLAVMVVLAISLRQCKSKTNSGAINVQRNTPNSNAAGNSRSQLDRTATNLFFTKHAKCRMKCRHITQQEVKDILVNGNMNYNKSDLNDARGPAYALEGYTTDRQHVRIIFAPKAQHLTVVTVIDLEEEFACNCD